MNLQEKLLKSSLFKDSFWSVFGNGLGNFLLLLAGIIIARFLGKDIYGEYGVVKTTMFHIASFATLGLSFTSTRFVAKYKNDNIALLKGSIRSSFLISISLSIIICLLLVVFSDSLSNFLDEPSLSMPFRFLGIIIICRSLSVTTSAILSGNKNFKLIGVNTIVSGLSMLILSAGLTYMWGLVGSLSALLLSQAILCFLNIICINKQILVKYRRIRPENNIVEMLKFTFPIALQEFSYTLSHLGGTLILTKYATLGDIGLFTAAGQWNAIILFIPFLLSNVVLAHLSGASTEKRKFEVVKIMLLVNFAAVTIPFLLVVSFSDTIVSLYGETFVSMKGVLNVLVFSTLFDCMCRVYQSNLISEGKNWILLSLRTIRDISLLVLTFLVLFYGVKENAAIRVAYVNLSISIGYFMIMSLEYFYTHRKLFFDLYK